MGFFGHLIPSLNTKSLFREGIKCPKKPIEMVPRGTPQKGMFWPPKCHFPGFPVLTSVGGPSDRKPKPQFWYPPLRFASQHRMSKPLFFCVFSEEFKGATRLGAIVAWEVLRGKSASERVSERTSERDGFRAFQRFSEVFQRFSEVFRGFQRFFKGPLRDPLRVPFSSQSCGSCCP